MVRGHWLKALQKEVNKFIRLRDKGQPCIACGTVWKPSFQASHFIPQGRSSFLRFDERNIHSGCIRCNLFVGGGNIHGYRRRLASKRLSGWKKINIELKNGKFLSLKKC